MLWSDSKRLLYHHQIHILTPLLTMYSNTMGGGVFISALTPPHSSRTSFFYCFFSPDYTVTPSGDSPVLHVPAQRHTVTFTHRWLLIAEAFIIIIFLIKKWHAMHDICWNRKSFNTSIQLQTAPDITRTISKWNLKIQESFYLYNVQYTADSNTLLTNMFIVFMYIFISAQGRILNKTKKKLLHGLTNYNSAPNIWLNVVSPLADTFDLHKQAWIFDLTS